MCGRCSTPLPLISASGKSGVPCSTGAGSWWCHSSPAAVLTNFINCSAAKKSPSSTKPPAPFASSFTPGKALPVRWSWRCVMLSSAAKPSTWPASSLGSRPMATPPLNWLTCMASPKPPSSSPTAQSVRPTLRAVPSSAFPSRIFSSTSSILKPVSLSPSASPARFMLAATALPGAISTARN